MQSTGSDIEDEESEDARSVSSIEGSEMGDTEEDKQNEGMGKRRDGIVKELSRVGVQVAYNTNSLRICPRLILLMRKIRKKLQLSNHHPRYVLCLS